MIRRPLYMNLLKEYSASELVKVITGVRRSGKSTLLKQLQNDLVNQGVSPEKLISVDFELPSNSALEDPQEFMSYVRDKVTSNELHYLFVDEVQELADWEKTINGLRAEYNLDIYVTGSNARMFDSENAVYLSGRYVSIHVLPLSLSELCQFIDVDETNASSVVTAYQKLVTEGSFPAIALSDSQALKNAILDGIYDSVFARDIILRGKIKNEAAFMRVASFLFDNIGNETSASSIERALKAGGHSVSAETIDNYLKLMKDAHLIYKCERFDLRGKERLRTNGKYYVVDMGLRQRVVGLKNSNRGHITENMVYLELLRRGYDVFVGFLKDAEIDFVANKTNEVFYIQVSDSVQEAKTLDRELAPFKKLKDSHPCILITKDCENISENGVRHINLYDFLLGQEL